MFSAATIPTIKLHDDDSVFVSKFFGFNRCFVQTFEGAESLLDLQEKIITHILNAKPLKKVPVVGEVVLGTSRDEIKNHRAVVEKIESETTVRVKFIDIGSENSLHYSDLRYPTAEIIQFPITGENFLLSGVPEDPCKILTAHFHNYCSRLSKNLRIQLENKGDAGEIGECKLYDLKNNNCCVNEEILKLGKWDWEVAFDKGLFNDSLQQYEGSPSHFYSLKPVDIPLGEEVTMEVALYSDPETFMCIPRIPSLEREFKVMETQMNLYLSTVMESSFFPAMNQLYFSKKMTLFLDGKWMRCTRFDHYGSLAVDFGTTFGFEGCDVRYMPKGFAEVPAHAVACQLDGIAKELDAKMKKIVEGILKLGNRLTCTVTAFHKDSGVYSIKCDEVIKALAEADLEKTLDDMEITKD